MHGFSYIFNFRTLKKIFFKEFLSVLVSTEHSLDYVEIDHPEALQA